MSKDRQWFNELFPRSLKTLLAILGIGLFHLLQYILAIPPHYGEQLQTLLMIALIWLSIRIFLLILELLNRQPPPAVKVQTKPGLLYLQQLSVGRETEQDMLESDRNICICIWNLGRTTECTVSITFPAVLNLNFDIDVGMVLENTVGCHSRRLTLHEGEAQLLIIRKVQLPLEMAERFRETSRTIRIEVKCDDVEVQPSVQEVHLEL